MSEGAYLLERVRARCYEEGDCLIWTGDVSGDGMRPRFFVDGARVPIRKALWEALHGPVKEGCRIGTSCKTLHCVEPAHLIQRTRSMEMKGIKRSTATKAKIAAARRVGSTYTPELVAEIRGSDLTHTALAESLNLPYKHIRRIRNFDIWKDYITPFAGLGARK